MTNEIALLQERVAILEQSVSDLLARLPRQEEGRFDPSPWAVRHPDTLEEVLRLGREYRQNFQENREGTQP